MTDRCRALFVNSGLLGHVSVALLIAEAMRHAPAIDARHVDAGRPRSLRERFVRRLVCAQFAPRSGPLANIDLHRWRAEMHSGLVASRRIRDATNEAWAPDVLHFHTQAAAYGSLRLMRRLPAIVSVDCTQTLARHEVNGSLARASYGPNLRRDGLVFRAARAIVATSEWAAADLRREYPESADRVCVMPYPVRADPEAPRCIEQRARRARNGDPVRFLFVGGDFPRKGGWDLLAAWSTAGLGSSATLHLVTNWPVPAARMPDGVRVSPGIEPYSAEWRSVWRDADVFVMPTRAEAFGMVYQEAAVSGLPSIGTRLAAIPEIIEDGTTGVLVDHGDTRGLVAALQRLASDAPLRGRLGAQAWARAVQRWDLSRYARSLGDVILRCAAREAWPT